MLVLVVSKVVKYVGGILVVQRVLVVMVAKVANLIFH